MNLTRKYQIEEHTQFVCLENEERFLYISNNLTLILIVTKIHMHRSHWPRNVRRGSTTSRLLGIWVRIPQGGWMFFSCEYCVLSGRGLCVELITRPEESYRVWRV